MNDIVNGDNARTEEEFTEDDVTVVTGVTGDNAKDEETPTEDEIIEEVVGVRCSLKVKR